MWKRSLLLANTFSSPPWFSRKLSFLWGGQRVPGVSYPVLCSVRPCRVCRHHVVGKSSLWELVNSKNEGTFCRKTVSWMENIHGSFLLSAAKIQSTKCCPYENSVTVAPKNTLIIFFFFFLVAFFRLFCLVFHTLFFQLKIFTKVFCGKFWVTLLFLQVEIFAFNGFLLIPPLYSVLLKLQ